MIIENVLENKIRFQKKISPYLGLEPTKVITLKQGKI